MKLNAFWKYAAAMVPAIAACAVLVACDGDSAETLVRNVGINVTGFYSNGGAPIASQNTGAPVTSLNLRQNGDQLDATDNNGIIFKGTLGQVSDAETSFTLNGQTTVGQSVTISGQIRVPVGSSDATMTGSWVEPNLFGTVAATATVPLNDDDDGDDGTNTNDTDNGSSTNSTTGMTFAVNVPFDEAKVVYAPYGVPLIPLGARLLR